jgi:uncharacterized protein (TIGR02145 family)
VKGGGRGICPKGWHIPTDREWAQLLDKVEDDGTGTTFTVSQTSNGWWGTDAGKKLKSSKVLPDANADNAPADGSWNDHANKGTDDYGFGAVPPGHRHHNGVQFYNRGTSVHYWNSTVGGSNSAWYRSLYYDNALSLRTDSRRSFGLSVRCVRD